MLSPHYEAAAAAAVAASVSSLGTERSPITRVVGVLAHGGDPSLLGAATTVRPCPSPCIVSESPVPQAAPAAAAPPSETVSTPRSPAPDEKRTRADGAAADGRSMGVICGGAVPEEGLARGPQGRRGGGAEALPVAQRRRPQQQERQRGVVCRAGAGTRESGEQQQESGAYHRDQRRRCSSPSSCCCCCYSQQDEHDQRATRRQGGEGGSAAPCLYGGSSRDSGDVSSSGSGHRNKPGAFIGLPSEPTTAAARAAPTAPRAPATAGTFGSEPTGRCGVTAPLAPLSPSDAPTPALAAEGAAESTGVLAPAPAPAPAPASAPAPAETAPVETGQHSVGVERTGTGASGDSSVWDLDPLEFEDERDEVEEEEEEEEGVVTDSNPNSRELDRREDLDRRRAAEPDDDGNDDDDKSHDSGGGGEGERRGNTGGQQSSATTQQQQPVASGSGTGGVARCEEGGRVGAARAEGGKVAPTLRAVTVSRSRARELMPPPPPNIPRANMRRRRARVTLMHSPRYQRLCGLLERHNRRDDLLYAMLGACGLPSRLTVVPPARATDAHLRAYHDRDYIEALRTPPSDVKALDEYGLVEDCEVFEELYEYCCAVAGASLHAADRLCRGDADVAINWGGGRHHAKKGVAGGFCYVNDCILAVLHLAKAFETVLVIDIDVHHGDGVQEAFYMSNKVMTMSFHHLAKGFFPGTGQCTETGTGKGRDFNLNIPLKEGCGDASFLRVFAVALKAVAAGFKPAAVVLLCGADTLSADPLGPFNLTSAGICSCVEMVVALELPMLLLGGGGYRPTDTARLWTSLTAAAVGADALAALPATIPDHAYFPLYGPDFRMATKGTTVPDKNDDGFIGRLCEFAAQAGRRASVASRKRARSDFLDLEFDDTEASVSW